MSTERILKINRHGDVTVITLGPDCENVDEECLEGLREPLLDAANSAVPPIVVLDLTETQFFGSSFIEVLFRIWNRINSQDGKFGISGLSTYCREVLEVTHLDQLWGIFESFEEAIDDFGKT
jgi:anti-anti-sigma factor